MWKECMCLGLVSTWGGKDERLFSRKSTIHFMLPYMFRHHTIHSSHLVHDLSHHCFHFQLRFVSFECCFVLSVSLNWKWRLNGHACKYWSDLTSLIAGVIFDSLNFSCGLIYLLITKSLIIHPNVFFWSWQKSASVFCMCICLRSLCLNELELFVKR